MRKTLFGFIALVLMLTSCNDDDKNTNTTVTEIRTTAGTGNWIVTTFKESEKDETSDFTGYTFTFASNGTVSAINGTNKHTGTWSVSDDDDDNESVNGNFDDIDFNIYFITPSTFEEISEDWEIVSLTDETMEFRHVSGGDGSVDLLTFKKL